MNVPEIKELGSYGALVVAFYIGLKVIVPWLLRQIEEKNAIIKELVQDAKQHNHANLDALVAIRDELRAGRAETLTGFDKVITTQNRSVEELRRIFIPNEK